MGLRAAKFRNDEGARRYVERIVWPSGPACPYCPENQLVYNLVSKPESVHQLPAGIYKCGRCRCRFSVITGTIFAGSHIALHKWLLASHVLGSTNQGISALQLQHELQLGSYRSAWFMSRRIRWALDRIPRRWQGEDAVAALLRVKPVPEMPRPGTRRQKSVWIEVDEELHGKMKKGRAAVNPRSAPGNNRF
jgi:transposase-like protein